MAAYDMDALMARLAGLGDAGYAEFNQSLIPGGQGPAFGVRVPLLRSIAKEIIKSEDWRAFLDESRESPVYELRLLHGMVLGGAKCPIDEKLAYTDAFLPHVDSWAVCDGFCTSFKPKAKEMGPVYDFVRSCALSDETFRKRFGLVMLMSRFHNEPWIHGTMEVYRGFRHPEYYARMAAAWGLATLWLSAREACLSILEENLWDEFTHNKAIQKLCESLRVSDSDKALVRTLRRNRKETT